MNDNLENFIRANRGAFDSREPDEKGWRRIEAALSFGQKTTFWNSLVLWRAAAILLFGVSSWLLVSRVSTTDDSKTSLKEFTEAEAYYTQEIFEKVKLIEDISQGDGYEMNEDFHQLDAMYQVLKEEMKVRPSKKVKDALILNLMVRINLLNKQLQQLEQQEEKDEGRSEEQASS